MAGKYNTKLKRLIKRIISATGFKNISINVNNSRHNKNCLISYIRNPFEEGPDNTHQNVTQIIEIARIMDDLAYNVDVIDYRSKKVIFNKKYDVLFEICIKKNPVYRNALKKDAKRIIYLTGSESEFANTAELKRLEELYARRGAKLQPRRQAPLIEKDIENFDKVIMIGNEYTLETYRKFKLNSPVLVPNTGYDFNFVFDDDKKKSDSFLYFGSAGCVHKGLDLLLEVFSEQDFPCKLYVCGNFREEQDFFNEYENELYHTNNIVPMGFVDVGSETFEHLCGECSFSILPSCSEGCAGTIATCMSAGLIPICSRVCGYDDDEVIVLEDCSKTTIKQEVLKAAAMDIKNIKERSACEVKLTKEKYCMSNFSKLMKQALSDTILYV